MRQEVRRGMWRRRKFVNPELLDFFQSMLKAIKASARKSKTSIIIYKIFDNWRLRRRFQSGNIETQHGSSHRGKSIEESIAYINLQFADYLSFSGINEDQLIGKRILELGSGDNVGLALRFLAAGASRVVCFDKFYSQRDGQQQRAIYQNLRDSLPPLQRNRFDEIVSLESGIVIDEKRLRSAHGEELEAAVPDLLVAEGKFDLIISRAVIEEIYSPDALFKATDKLLAPGGFVLHKIDLSDYGIFSGAGMHPLTFLTIPEAVYRLMASDSGIPNRKLVSYYKKQLEDLGYDYIIFATSLIGHGPLDPGQQLPLSEAKPELRTLVAEIRPSLSREFVSASDDDLLIDGIFVVGKATGN
jgi:hypothetical protein